MRTFPWRLLTVVAVAGLAVACEQDSSPVPRDNEGALVDWLGDQDGNLGGDTDTTSNGGTTDEEVVGTDEEPVIYCTLADDGQECSTSGGGTGLTKCVAGILKCWECQPGETRDAGCGCGVARSDTCQDDGRWRKGVCDSCTSDPAPIPCGFCGEVDAGTGTCVGAGVCEPDSVRYERCDVCPEGETCAPGSCIGKKFVCNAGCEWELKEDCGVRAKQCDGELKRNEKCGVCGDMTIACDGCFWDWPDVCDNEEQECYPGTARHTECFGNSCTEGWRSTISCGADCRWSPPSKCIGCTEGWQTEWQDCVYGKPGCGKRQIQYLCTVPDSTGTCDVPLGTKSNFSTLVECPPIECYPGQGRGENCTLGDGRGGTQTATCQNDCSWGEMGACVGSTTSCIPGEVKEKLVDCGCGVKYTQRDTCNTAGTGWVKDEIGKDACPECLPGDHTEQGCQVSGTCGTQKRTCSAECKWETAACSQASWACLNGDTKQGACYGTCGSGTASYVCSGCGWVQTTSCYPSEQPACSPGQNRTTECRPGVPECGTREEFCSSTCQWAGEQCPQCG